MNLLTQMEASPGCTAAQKGVMPTMPTRHEGREGGGGEVRRAELTSAAIQGAGFHVSLGPGQEMLTL